MPLTKTTLSPAPSTPAELAFRSMIRAFGLLRRVMEPYFTQFGISGAQWGVLRTLHRAAGEGLAALRLTDLSQRLLIRPPSVTGVVDRLERMGMVTRVTSAADQRAKEVKLTTAGQDLLDRILAGHSQRVNSLMSKFSPAEQGRLKEMMERLSSHLETVADSEESGIEPGMGKDDSKC